MQQQRLIFSPDDFDINAAKQGKYRTPPETTSSTVMV